MKMTEVRKLAKELGINAFGKSKVMLVRAIQKKEGNFDCFARVIDYCDQSGCCFRQACFKEAEKARPKRARKKSLTGDGVASETKGDGR